MALFPWPKRLKREYDNHRNRRRCQTGRETISLVAAGVLLAGLLIYAAAAELPPGFFAATSSPQSKDAISVQNYQSGAALTEAYWNIQQLNRNTEVRTRATSYSNVPGGALEASFSSQFIGQAHIGWRSYDPAWGEKGRYATIGKSVEDLTGVFSIEKFIQLGAGSQPGEVNLNWLPCS
jgi:hypothetical protein